jgi:hypothetical protein
MAGPTIIGTNVAVDSSVRTSIARTRGQCPGGTQPPAGRDLFQDRHEFALERAVRRVAQFHSRSAGSSGPFVIERFRGMSVAFR